jgi:hypothetical protein
MKKHHINAFSKIPYMRTQAQRLHKENIKKVIAHHFKYSIPFTANIILANKHSKLHKSFLSTKLIKSDHPLMKFRNFIIDRKYTVVRADKTPQLCIVPQKLYNDCVFRHLNDVSTYEAIPRSRHNAINKVVNRVISELQVLRGYHNIRNNNYSDRQFRILLKIQKDPRDWINFPSIPKTRPIVSDANSITAKATRTILPIFQKFEYESKYVCISSLEVVNQIETLNQTKGVTPIFITTADVEAMYTNINTGHVIEILGNPEYDIENKASLLEILRRLLRYTTFVYEDKTYLQKKGLAMGNPLSGTLANIYLAFFENQIIPKYKDNIILYKRYIDDILILSRDENQTLKMISEISDLSHLKMTTCTSKQRNSFLDLMIVQRADNRLITYPSYKYASPIRRSYLGNENRESRVIISQILRLWRITNSTFHFTQSIAFIIKYLRMQGCPTRCIDSIHTFIRPILTANGTFVHTHKLCNMCNEKCTNNIKVLKSVEIQKKTLASKQPLTCHQKPITCLVHKQSQWKLIKDTSIHTLVQECSVSECTNILPLGFMSLDKFNIFIRKHRGLLNDEIVPEKTKNIHPCHIHAIATNPRNIYGIYTARHRLRSLHQFLKKTNFNKPG